MSGFGFGRARCRAVLVVVLGLLLLPAAARALTGGKRISISQAPWAVAISEGVSFRCTGVIIDSLHVLTAGHCVKGASPLVLRVLGGVSNFDHPQPADAPQTRHVASFRLHPAGIETDLAVLQLSAPLQLDGVHTRAIALRRSNTFAAQRAVVAGFGEEKPGQQPAGALTEITEWVQRQGRCGQNDLISPDVALHLCASSPQAGACLGDSGAGLVSAGPHPVLLGVLNLIIGKNCVAKNTDFYTYVGAPEVWRFIGGDDHPPLAPKSWGLMAGGGVVWRVGDEFLCAGAGVDGARTHYELFLDGRRVQVSSHAINYPITRVDIGKRFTCKGTGTTAGGTSVDQWTSLPVKRQARA